MKLAHDYDSVYSVLFRAWVVDSIGAYVKVLYVDWGNIETVEVKEVYNTSPEVWTLRPMATPFRYKGKLSMNNREKS